MSHYRGRRRPRFFMDAVRFYREATLLRYHHVKRGCVVNVHGMMLPSRRKFKSVYAHAGVKVDTHVSLGETTFEDALRNKCPI